MEAGTRFLKAGAQGKREKEAGCFCRFEKKKENNKGELLSRCSLSERQERTKVRKARPVSAGRIDDGEFDPGSERTLAARFKHASRANGHLRVDGSGGRVSNTWVICPGDGNSTWKHVVMPDTTACTEVRAGKGATAPPRDEPAAH